jgi:serine/threonine protein kinase/tetratricopeptide (TPR) repeat protein
MANMHPERWLLIEEVFHKAVELTANERRDFIELACGEDVLLRAEIEKLIDGNERAGSFIETPPVLDESTIALPGSDDEPLAGLRLGAYEVIREIGRGGMGTVYLAARADEEFRKRVAIKLVTAGFDHESIIQRFRNERQILAGLDHPNIARLLDGGTTETGAPYFVMEYIEGETIRDYCDGHRLTTLERLKLFRAVCSAVHFAHQNLIVHRDIKPGNILVTPDGTPKLLDFGVAKLLSPIAQAGEITEVTSRVMTPEYASPEQARGETITTASDVYSLGVLLYELLTGHRPYSVSSRSLIEVIEAICEEEPARPSAAVGRTVTSPEAGGSTAFTLSPETISDARGTEPHRLRRELEGDLDNIVLKAMRKEPQRRYASVEQFSEDIQRYFQHLPVIARQDTLSYRTSKFMSRHKAGVAAAALVIVALFAGGLTTVWQAHVARQQRDKAEHRFNQVRKLANAVLFDYHDGIEKLPGSTPMRERMVKDALEYLDNLSAEGSGDDTLQRELASAYEKVGDVQGAPYRANLGNYKGALVSHNKALAIRAKLNSTSTESEQTKLELARSYGAVGELSQVTGNIPAALENYAKAFAVLASLSNGGVEAERQLSVLHVRFGRALKASGELAKALEHFRQGVAITNKLLAASPNDQRLKRDLAFASIFLGDGLQDAGDLKEALTAQRTASALLEPLVTQTNAQSRRDVGVPQQRVAALLEKMGDKRGALEIHLRLLSVDEELAKADPSNALARRDVYIDYYKLAFLQESMHEMKAAIANQQICVALCEAEVASNPASAESHADLGVGYFRLGEMLENSGSVQEALVNYKNAVAIQEAMSNADPSNTVARGDLSEDYLKVSDVFLKLGNRAEALKGYLNALAMRKELVAATPDDAESRMQLARIYEGLGGYYISMAATEKRLSDWREARRWYQQSLETFNGLQQQNRLSSDYAKKPSGIRKAIETCDAVLAKL